MQFSVCVGSPVYVDLRLYSEWLNGVAFEEAALGDAFRQQYVLTQYRHFTRIEHYLQEPRQFVEQLMFPVKSDIKKILVENYFSFDDVVMRELFDCKLTSRSRKDLDEVYEKTRISRFCCRRQFENVKRIFRKVEEMEGNLVENIGRKFLLPRQLASAYAVVIFINANKLETTKRRLQMLEFRDYEALVSVVIERWVNPNDHLEFDMTMAQDMRDIKSLLFGSKDLQENFRMAIIQMIDVDFSGKLQPSLYRQFLKSALDIGGGFSNPKQVRSLFLDILEMIIEPCVSSGWGFSDFAVFICSADDNFKVLEKWNPGTVKKRYIQSFSRLMVGLSAMIHHLIKISCP